MPHNNRYRTNVNKKIVIFLFIFSPAASRDFSAYYGYEQQ